MSKTDSKKKRVYASNAVVTTIFVVGAIVLVNLISTRVFGRKDLTEAQVYTISQGSKDLVKNLPDYMTVKAFLSSDLPPELKPLGQYIRDLVDEYKTSSNGKFRWSAIDPAEDKKLQEEASRCKVEQLQVQVMRSQKFEFANHYLGLCLQYGDQIESIPRIASQEGLEYQITSLIKKMTQKKRKVVFTTGHGEADTNQGFQALKEELAKEFEVSSVNPSSAELPADADALIVGGPKQAIDEKGQREIDKFLMRGKNAIILVDGMAMTSPQQGGMPGMENQIKMGQPNETGLGKLLETYGFKINQDFVFDAAASVPGPIQMGGRTMLANLPVYIAGEIQPAKDLAVLSGVRMVAFPYASSVDLVGPLKDGKAPAGAQLWKIASSSEESWKHTGFFILSPTQPPTPSKEVGAFALGYAFNGVLKSAFPPAAPEAPMSGEDKKNEARSESAKPVRLLVMGDSDFANDEYVQLSRHPILQVYANGAQLLFNAIAWTAEDETLTPLRTKTVTSRPLSAMSDGKVLTLRAINIAGLPLAFCLYGVGRWRLRKASRQSQKL